MLNKIIEGIAIRLNKLFGDEYPIYRENIDQGLNEPCFLITCISAQAAEMLSERYHRDNAFNIQYFPELPDNKTEMLAIAERMYAGLNHITLTDGSVKNGTDMRHEVVDGVLNFFIDFNTVTQRQYMSDELMSDAEINIAIKEDK